MMDVESVWQISQARLPAGASPSFASASVAVPGSTTLSIATATTTPVGTYTLTITAASGTLTHSTTVSLVVNPAPDFTLSMAPGSQTINAGDSTSFTASIGSIGGYANTVTLSVTGVPTGATPTFTPSNSVIAPGSVTLSLANHLNIRPRHALYTATGGNTPQWLVNRTAEEIANGECDVALMAGAEYLATFIGALKAGVALDWSADADPGSDPQEIGQEKHGTT